MARCPVYRPFSAMLPALALLAMLAALLSPRALAADPAILEDFESLEAWEPLTFEKIESHSSYEAASVDGRSALMAVSNSSASALVHASSFDVFKTPILTWTWRAESVYAKGDARHKEGDDYPLRIYVLFEYNPEEAGLGERVTFGVLKTLYGEYPPKSTLNYIWANREHDQEVITNPFTDRAMMIPVQSGPQQLGEWVRESRNILEDYRLAFGEDPPAKAKLAVMNDSDNTGEASVSYLDCIRVSSRNGTEAAETAAVGAGDGS